MIYKGKTVVLKDGRVAVLRSPKDEDAEGLLKFLQICAVETEFILRNADECGLTLETEKQFILNAVSSPEIMMITAFIDGEVVGNCQFSFKNLEKVKHRAGIAIGTLKKCWGSGLGAELMTALCEEAKNCGIEQMELEYIDGNIRAEKFYKKMGFTEFARRPDAVRIGGVSHSDVWMLRRL